MKVIMNVADSVTDVKFSNGDSVYADIPYEVVGISLREIVIAHPDDTSLTAVLAVDSNDPDIDFLKSITLGTLVAIATDATVVNAGLEAQPSSEKTLGAGHISCAKTEALFR